MVLPQVQLLHAQPTQARVHGLAQVLGPAVGGPAAAVGAHVAALGGQQHPVPDAELVEQTGHQALVLALAVRPELVTGAVGVRGVQQRHAHVDRGAQGVPAAAGAAARRTGRRSSGPGPPPRRRRAPTWSLPDLSCLHARGVPPRGRPRNPATRRARPAQTAIGLVRRAPASPVVHPAVPGAGRGTGPRSRPRHAGHLRGLGGGGPEGAGQADPHRGADAPAASGRRPGRRGRPRSPCTRPGPGPVPWISWRRATWERKNRWNSSGCSSALIPMPLSETSTTTLLLVPVDRDRHQTPGGGETWPRWTAG